MVLLDRFWWDFADKTHTTSRIHSKIDSSRYCHCIYMSWGSKPRSFEFKTPDIRYTNGCRIQTILSHGIQSNHHLLRACRSIPSNNHICLNNNGGASFVHTRISMQNTHHLPVINTSKFSSLPWCSPKKTLVECSGSFQFAQNQCSGDHSLQ